MAAAAPYIIAGVTTLMTMNAEKKAAEKKAELGKMKAADLEIQAGQEIASSQRRALNEKRNTDLVASRAVAVAAASGGSASDPTVVNILSDIKGEGAYRQATALYEGRSRSQQLRREAEMARAGADFALQSGRTQQLTTAMRGANSIYNIYSRQHPPTTSMYTYDL